MITNMNAYVSPSTLSKAFGVSSSTLKRWSDKGILPANRTAGGHRRFSISDAIQVSRKHGIPFRNPTVIGLPPTIVPGEVTEGKAPFELLLESLESNAFHTARDIISGLFIGGIPLTELFQDIIVPAIARIGMDWTKGPVAIAREHASSQLILESLGSLRSLLPQSDDRIFAVGCAPANDPYRIPTTMVSLVVQNQSKRAINLGPDLPLESLVEFCRSEKPRIAWLSLTSDGPIPALQKSIYTLAEELKETNTTLAIGGRQANRLLKKPIENVAGFASLEQFSQFCRGLGHSPDQ